VKLFLVEYWGRGKYGWDKCLEKYPCWEEYKDASMGKIDEAN
jgi:hypothetical protein